MPSSCGEVEGPGYAVNVAMTQIEFVATQLYRHGHSDRHCHEHADVMAPIGLLRGLEGYQRVASRFGLELRDPFADTQVLDFCLRLRLSVKTHRGWTKWLLRAYCANDLPESVVWNWRKDHLGWLIGSATAPA